MNKVKQYFDLLNELLAARQNKDYTDEIESSLPHVHLLFLNEKNLLKHRIYLLTLLMLILS